MREESVEPLDLQKPNEEKPKNGEIHWFNVLLIIHLQMLSLYGIAILTQASWSTLIFNIAFGSISFFGISAGAHRLWAHRAYEANSLLKIFLMLCFSAIGEGSLYNWILNHRLHHKYRGTNGDPYNHRRGFLYSHFICNMYKPTPEIEELKKTIDMSDIENDSVVMWQKKYCWIVVPLMCVLIPADIPIELCNESFRVSFFLTCLRYTIVLHMAWLVNSAFLVWRLKPGEKYPINSSLIFVMSPTYWPQYHYLLPWDYRTDEFGTYGKSCTTKFIQIAEVLNMAHMMNTVDYKDVLTVLQEHMESKNSFKECVSNLESSVREQSKNDYYKSLPLISS